MSNKHMIIMVALAVATCVSPAGADTQVFYRTSPQVIEQTTRAPTVAQKPSLSVSPASGTSSIANGVSPGNSLAFEISNTGEMASSPLSIGILSAAAGTPSSDFQAGASSSCVQGKILAKGDT